DDRYRPGRRTARKAPCGHDPLVAVRSQCGQEDDEPHSQDLLRRCELPDISGRLPLCESRRLAQAGGCVAMVAEVDLVPLIDEGLGNSAYLVDLGDGRALVVDVSRDLRSVHAAAARRG